MDKWDRDPWHDAETIPLWLIVLIFLIFLVGCEEAPQESKKSSPLYYWCDIELFRVGVSAENTSDCMRWAFGDDYLTSRGYELNDRWNERHQNLFIMYDSDDRNEAIGKVGKAYLENK